MRLYSNGGVFVLIKTHFQVAVGRRLPPFRSAPEVTGKPRRSCFSPRPKLLTGSTQDLAGFSIWLRHGNLRTIDSTVSRALTVSIQSDPTNISVFLGWGGADPLHPAAEPAGEDAAGQVLRPARGLGEAQGWIRGKRRTNQWYWFGSVLDLLFLFSTFLDFVSCRFAGTSARGQSGP